MIENIFTLSMLIHPEAVIDIVKGHYQKKLIVQKFLNSAQAK